jgi:hypothetical protein
MILSLLRSTPGDLRSPAQLLIAPLDRCGRPRTRVEVRAEKSRTVRAKKREGSDHRLFAPSKMACTADLAGYGQFGQFLFSLRQFFRFSNAQPIPIESSPKRRRSNADAPKLPITIISLVILYFRTTYVTSGGLSLGRCHQGRKTLPQQRRKSCLPIQQYRRNYPPVSNW